MTAPVAGPSAAGVVASGHPRAAQAGRDALAGGGSVVDAVLRMAFTQWVVNAPLCGPGGDLFVLHVKGDQATVYGGWSGIPLAFPAGGPVPYSGPGAAVVPGALAGAHAAWSAHGRLGWADLFASGLEAAEGHEVTPWMATSYASVVARGNGPALQQVLDQQEPPAAGAHISTRRLGASLAVLADAGPGALYDGPLGQRLVAAITAQGGYLRAEDLAAVRAQVCPAEVAELDGLTIALPGLPSQAGLTVELLEAVGRTVPVESPDFARALAAVTQDALIRRCVVGLPGTAVSTAAAGDEAAIVVHSLAGVQFGTGWVAGDTGIALGNRVGTALSDRPDLPAANPRPGALMPHTLSAAWLRSGDRSMLVASPGGDRQVQWLAQSAQRFRQGADLAEVVAGPRWFVCPEGDRFGVPQGIGAEWFLFAEPGITWRDETELAGLAVRPVTSVGGGVQAVSRTTATDWSSGSDPRAGGAALAVEP
ncbi:MAG: gamma-glutamyltransferase [Frankiales bacterium]|nr:gamma-glutamyltransferase [Frankiales bacterium]